ncbi:hypothetical protein [Lachnoclostridium sp.]|uniref:hypothetical protein n=1 Tax=Lachnoclostridium sp. TaxID=2028282 RepID=UPI00289DCA32|nr:hypothetical protein [Lachnoclostridium sp.]
MENFIAEKIINARLVSLEEGRSKYSLYFIKSSGNLLYGKYQNNVNEILIENECENCIIAQS